MLFYRNYPKRDDRSPTPRDSFTRAITGAQPQHCGRAAEAQGFCRCVCPNLLCAWCAPAWERTAALLPVPLLPTHICRAESSFQLPLPHPCTNHPASWKLPSWWMPPIPAHLNNPAQRNQPSKMKAHDHLPTHLGRGELHTRRLPPRQVMRDAPSSR